MSPETIESPISSSGFNRLLMVMWTVTRLFIINTQDVGQVNEKEEAARNMTFTPKAIIKSH